MLSSLLPILLVSFQLVAAFPATPSHKEHATHRTRALPNRRSIKTYHPKSQFEVYNRGLARRGLSSEFDPSKYRDSGLHFVQSKFGSNAQDADDMEIVSAYDEPHASHVWVRQKVAGLRVANTLASVVQNSKGDVLSYSSSFVAPKSGNSFTGYTTTPKLSIDQAAASAVKTLGGRHDASHAPSLEFYVVESGDLKLTHSLRMHLADGDIVQAYVDANDGTVHGIIDYTSDLSARVVPVTDVDITSSYQLLHDLGSDKSVSPDGWTFAAGAKFPAERTLGNNVFAASLETSGLLRVLNGASPNEIEADIVNSATKFTSPDTFDYTPDITVEPTTRQNRDASVVNVWYLANMAHDILYRYGFTEKAFNFQLNNPNGEGKANDPVAISVQDKADKNNAKFAALPDGEASFLITFLFNVTQPDRDSGFDNAVVLHEYAHGLTNRMTGGGTAMCLQTTESGGLGEGWSDAFAEWVSQSTSTHIRDFITGGFVIGNETAGIRGFPYSVNKKVNPLTYGHAKERQEVHDIGEIWSQTLHNVHATLVLAVGTGSALDALTNPDSESAHSVFMRLFVDALAIQPCNPTFIDARDAIIQADQNRYAGKHRCALWLGFALVGLGEGAKDFINSHAIPSDCPPVGM
ncbi:Fungalysin metallopeptidase-domain-containing protein [Auriculariales sp. MPI-PUGE-AT-0066]|nr:Fungalysin metallopeptidase-domain-containing protein [Auriculariales sp. MPI-PUGE-AT-0066]